MCDLLCDPSTPADTVKRVGREAVRLVDTFRHPEDDRTPGRQALLHLAQLSTVFAQAVGLELMDDAIDHYSVATGVHRRDLREAMHDSFQSLFKRIILGVLKFEAGETDSAAQARRREHAGIGKGKGHRATYVCHPPIPPGPMMLDTEAAFNIPNAVVRDICIRIDETLHGTRSRCVSAMFVYCLTCALAHSIARLHVFCVFLGIYLGLPFLVQSRPLRPRAMAVTASLTHEQSLCSVSSTSKAKQWLHCRHCLECHLRQQVNTSWILCERWQSTLMNGFDSRMQRKVSVCETSAPK